jgi:hypothetical protein
VKARSPRRLSGGLATLAALVLALSVPALSSAASSQGAEAARAQAAATATLAKRYAPITMLREETDPPCQTSAEQYEPTSVDTVLGNPTVTLQKYVEGEGLQDIVTAPTVADVAGLGDNYYLNLEGKALGETCVYAKAFRKLVEEGKAPAVSYAHIAREPNHGGFALQYWFFWYFNQFNDLHEGDWEGMQVSFESETVNEALGEEPSEIIVFQHAGGERADWDDSKVQKEGTHPIVYPAAGSHATFYGSAVYVQNGQNGSGLGCDRTTAPLREVRPRPILMPDTAPETGPFAWLTYDGRWGELEKSYNNGPQGPQTKTVWREPFAWMADQRSTSPHLPGGSVLGPQVAGAFCGAVSAASELVNLDIRSRAALIATLAAIALAIALFVGFTRWGPVDLTQLRARRSFGQIVRTARRLYGRHWLVLLPVAVVAIPIVGAVNLLASLLGNSQASGDNGGVSLALGDLVETLGRPAAMAVVAAIVVVFVRELVEGADRPGFRAAFRGMERRFWRVVAGQMLVVLALIGLVLTVIGIPFAVYKYVAWSFVKQEILFEDKSIREAFHGSADLVRGRWWHSVRVVAFLFVISVVTGPVLTFALIFTSLSLTSINLLGSLVFALLIPYVALGETLLYFDLGTRAAVEPAKPPRSWRPWKPRQFGRVRHDPSPQPAPSG